MEQITDYAARMKGRLPNHLDTAVEFAKLIDVIAAQVQDLETTVFQLLDERHLSVAVGAQLDGLGQILDLAREIGQTDEDYRAELIGRTGVLAQSGQIEVLIETMLRLTGAAFLTVLDTFPAGITLVAHLDADPENPDVDESVRDAMQEVAAAGVRLILEMAPETEFLELSSETEADVNNNGPSDANRGLGDELLTEGGGLARSF